MVTVVRGHAYPWDVLGDPSFPARVRDLGLSGVTLAAAYHSVRAATPLHPRHQIVDATHAALYRPVRESVWAGRRLRPGVAHWMDTPDPFATAGSALRAAGLPVGAWIVLTHSTRLGTAHPEVAVTNCFGERYGYALCPAHEEVREYAATLAAEAVREAPVDAVSLEACGQLGVAHPGHHDKTDGAWTPAAARLLSVCCCRACQAEWRRRGLDPEKVLTALWAGVYACQALAGPTPAGSASGLVGAPAGEHPGPLGEVDPAMAAVLLAARQEATDMLRLRVLAAIHEQAPGVPVTLHAHPDPWVTGPSPGLTPTAAGDVDALLVPAWPTTPDTADLVGRATAAGRAVDAYLTVLAPASTEASPDALTEHARRLKAAGASRFSLYHLGLAPRWRQRLFPDLIAAVR